MNTEVGHVFQDSLYDFATRDFSDREARLPGLIKSLDNPDIYPSLAEIISADSQNQLVRAADHVTATPFLMKQERFNPWAGGYTVVQISEVGQIEGLVSNPVGNVYKIHGPLEKFAFAKALIALHTLDWKETLEDEASYDYVANRLSISPIYLGDAKSMFVGPLKAYKFVVGASGSGLKHDYLETLLPKEMSENIPEDFLAGYADQIFAKEVARRLVDLRLLDVDTFTLEPKFFRDFRRFH